MNTQSHERKNVSKPLTPRGHAFENVSKESSDTESLYQGFNEDGTYGADRVLFEVTTQAKNARPTAKVSKLVLPKIPRKSFHNPDHLGDLKKELKKKQRDIRRQIKYDIQPQMANATRLSGGCPQMFSVPTIPVKIEFGSDMASSLSDFTNVIKNINIEHKFNERTLEEFADMSMNLGTRDKNINIGLDKYVPGNELSAILSFLKSDMPRVIIVIVLAVVIVKYCPQAYGERVMFNSLVFMLAMTYLGMSDFNMMDMFDGAQTKPQNLEMHDFGKILASMFNMFLCARSGKKIFEVDFFINVLQKIGKTGSGVTSLVESITILAKGVRDMIERFFNVEKDDTFVLTGHEFIDVFMRECQVLIKMDDNHELYGARTSVDRVKEAIKLGESISLKIPNLREWVSIRIAIHDSLAKLNAIKKKLLNTNYTYSGVRQEPVAILIRGPPGAGKSTAMQHLTNALAGLILDEKELKLYSENNGLFIFNRMSEVKYWDGYDANKRFVFFDDLLQQRDVEGEPDNEIFNVIRAINCFEMQLHMAAIEGKGSTMLRADFIIANTNVRRYDFKSINEAGAFLRRWDIIVDVVPRDEYCVDPKAPFWDKVLDNSKLPIIDGVSSRMPSILDFHVCKMQKNGNVGPGFYSTGEVIDWKSLVSRTFACYVTKKKWHGLYVNQLKKTLEEYSQVDENFDPPVPQTRGTCSRKGKERQSASEDDFHDAKAEWENIPGFSHADLDGPFGVGWPVTFQAGSSFNDFSPEFLSSGLFAEPELAALKDEWRMYSPQMYSKYNAFYTYVWLSLNIQWHIAAPHYLLVDAFRQCEWKSYIQDDDEYMRRECVYKMIRNVIAYIDTDPKSSRFAEYIETAREEYNTLRMSRTLPIWKKIVFDAYVWCSSWVSTSRMEIHEIFDPKLSTGSKLAAGIKLGTKVYIVYFAVKMFATLVHNLWGPSHYSDRERTIGSSSHQVSRNVIQTGKIPHLIVKPHSLASQSKNVMDIVRSISRRNVYEWWSPIALDCRKNSTHELSGFATAVAGNYLLVPYHFIAKLSWEYSKGYYPKDEIVEIRSVMSREIIYRDSVESLIGTVIDSSRASDMDAILVKFTNMQPAKDIRKLFCTEKQMERYSCIDAIIYVPFNDPNMKEVHNLKASRYSDNITIGADKWAEYKITNYWKYTNTKIAGGDCGCLIFADDKTKGSVLVGMHVAGVESNRIGFGTVLTYEFIEELMKEHKQPIGHFEQFDLSVEETNDSRSNMEYVGKVSPQQSIINVGKTKIVRSPLWGTYKQPLTAPAKLKQFLGDQGEIVDPMNIALNKCCKTVPYIKPYLVEVARDNLFDALMYSSSIAVSRTIYSFEEAVLGDGSEWFGSIPRVTSAGFPYVKMTGKRSKERFFGSAMEYSLENQECIDLKAQCELIVRKAAEGVRCLHIFIDCLKDERRTHDKVRSGNTRLFSGGPTPLLIVMRQYFGAFMKWIQANSIENGCAVSVNPYSKDWDGIGRRLSHFGRDMNNIGAGDFSNFDMSQSPQIQNAVLDIVNRWYDDGIENYKIREVLFLEITNSLHLVRDKLYYWKSGLPSGALATTFVNNLYDHISFRVCWNIMVGVQVDFNKHVKLITTGDDNARCVSVPYREIFTDEKLKPVFEKIGLKFGPENKVQTNFAPALRNLHEITFNKRRFVFDHSLYRYVGPLDLDVILECPMWLKDGACSIGDLEANLSLCFNELSIHDEGTFDKWSSIILPEVDKVAGLHRPFSTQYIVLRKETLSRGIAPVFEEDIMGVLSSDDILPQSWLRTHVNEFRDGKSCGSLYLGRERRIYGYCQEALPAVLANSRNHDLIDPLAHGRFELCANTTPTTQVAPSASKGEEKDNFNITSVTSTQPDLFSGSSTTHGIADGEVVRGDTTNYFDVKRDIILSTHPGTMQEVRNFLEKPVLFSSGVLQTTDTPPANIFLAGAFGTFLLDDLYAAKLQGNYAFRGTLVLTLQVNANRFQQGRYILAWVPDGGGNNPNTTPWLTMHTASLTQLTQTPHVELDVACDTAAILEIPLVNTIGWTTISSEPGSQYNNGYVLLRCYSPLVAPTGSTQAGYTLYAHFKDIEFNMPVVPQMSARIKSKIRRRIQPEKEEQDAANIGPISGALSKISEAAAHVEGIPLLSSIAGPVRWVSDVGAKVAKTLGWSKPHDEAPHCKVARYIMPKFNNADTVDQSTKLSVYDTARLQELPGFAGSSLDEMSFTYVSTISSYFSNISWSTSNVEGDVLRTYSISPRDFSLNDTYGAFPVTFPTPLAWCGNFFSLWRGDIRLTFKIVKTEFHSGRLLFAFLPFDADVLPVPGTPSVDDTSFLLREIIDIRCGNEFTITIPYLSLTAYHNTFGNDRMIGTGHLYVLNPLTAPANVSSSITILVEASAGPNIEFAEPRDVLERPVVLVTPHSGRKDECAIEERTMGNSKGDDNLAYAATCIGERVLSFRSLIKRFNAVAASSLGAANFYLPMIPWGLPVDYLSAANVLTVSEVQYPDIMTHISLAYALSRGAVRVKILARDPAANLLMLARDQPWPLSATDTLGSKNLVMSATPLVSGGTGIGTNFTAQYSNISGGLEVENVYYNRSWCHPTSDAMNNFAITANVRYDNSSMAPRHFLQLWFPVSTNNILIFRAGGEDFSLGLFVSTPAYLDWTTSVA